MTFGDWWEEERERPGDKHMTCSMIAWKASEKETVKRVVERIKKMELARAEDPKNDLPVYAYECIDEIKKEFSEKL